MYQLKKFAEILQNTCLPLTIEPSIENTNLDVARREFVLDALARLGMPLNPEMVIVDKPRAFGLSGEESEVIYPNQILQTQDGGRSRISRGSVGSIGGG
jgi:hypothetical protein